MHPNSTYHATKSMLRVYLNCCFVTDTAASVKNLAKALFLGSICTYELAIYFLLCNLPRYLGLCGVNLP